MLGILMMGMVMGCDGDDETEIKTIDSEYWGYYKYGNNLFVYVGETMLRFYLDPPSNNNSQEKIYTNMYSELKNNRVSIFNNDNGSITEFGYFLENGDLQMIMNQITSYDFLFIKQN